MYYITCYMLFEELVLVIKKLNENDEAVVAFVYALCRKSVYFSEVVTDCDTPASNFSKYLMPSSDSGNNVV